jgi:hypothetical protein
MNGHVSSECGASICRFWVRNQHFEPTQRLRSFDFECCETVSIFPGDFDLLSMMIDHAHRSLLLRGVENPLPTEELFIFDGRLRMSVI